MNEESITETDQSVIAAVQAFFDKKAQNGFISHAPFSGIRLLAHWHAIHRIRDVNFELVAPFLPGADVLDIGCGMGQLSERLQMRARRVYALDLSYGMLSYVRTHLAGDIIEPLLGNTLFLPFPDGSLDVVVSSETIEHVPDPQGMLREMKRVVRTGGVIGISTPNLYSEFFRPRSLVSMVRHPRVWLRRFQRNAPDPDHPLQSFWIAPHILRRWAYDQGLCILRHKSAILNDYQSFWFCILQEIEPYVPQLVEKIYKAIIKMSDVVIERQILPFSWMGIRQFILLKKVQSVDPASIL